VSQGNEKLWDGRFSEATDAFVEAFTASVTFDFELALFDIEGSVAHATMLGRCGIIDGETAKAIIRGLNEIRADIEAGVFTWSVQLEDVHMNIEAALTDRIGEQGKALHTGRSRNDQVATDVRMYLRHNIDLILEQIRHLQRGLLNLAEGHCETILPGFTHLQVAQPVVFGHHLMAWYEMLRRDADRLQDCRRRVNTLPLGAAALAGTSFPIDRAMVADLLGFEAIAENSLDAVSDRDFAIEFTSAASLLMMHLSRWSEEMILWASPQFAFIELPDRFCTGSSIMPQKKNPDVPELVRGKAARVFGSLIALLTLMKSQPLAYNKDNQEDKEPLIDTVRTLKDCLRAFGDMIPNIKARPDNMRAAAERGFATATDLADYLVRKGLAFRDAHHVVGRLVGLAVERGVDLAELTLADFETESDQITEDVYAVLTLEGSVAARSHLGGTAPDTVRAAIARARHQLG
jgi:argininosuccinate lyase